MIQPIDGAYFLAAWFWFSIPVALFLAVLVSKSWKQKSTN